MEKVILYKSTPFLTHCTLFDPTLNIPRLLSMWQVSVFGKEISEASSFSFFPPSGVTLLPSLSAIVYLCFRMMVSRASMH